MSHDVHLATILGAHGLKGEVRVKTFTETPEKLGAYGPLYAKDGRSFALAALRGGSEGEAVAAFKEIADRAAAEKLKGTELFVSREALPPTLTEEFYHADLVGMTVYDTEGRHLGKVSVIHNYGASDVLAIADGEGGEILIAFTRENVPEIDINAGRLVVAVPGETEAGKEGGVE